MLRVGPRDTSKSAEKVFGRQISRLRRQLGFSQEELAFRAGLHRNYVGSIERGEKSPTLHVIRKLAKALHKPASRLIASVEKKIV